MSARIQQTSIRKKKVKKKMDRTLYRRSVLTLCALLVAASCAEVQRGTVYVAWHAASEAEAWMVRHVLALNTTAEPTARTIEQALAEALDVQHLDHNATSWHVVSNGRDARMLLHVTWHESTHKRAAAAAPGRLDVDVAHQLRATLVAHALDQYHRQQPSSSRGAQKRTGFLGEQTPPPELRVILESARPLSRTLLGAPALDPDVVARIAMMATDPGTQQRPIVATSISPVPWHLDRLDQMVWPPASDTYPTFELGPHDDIIVAVVDGGVDPTQPQLRGRVDTLLYGGKYDTLPRDSDFHGTHVAGTIAGPHTGVARDLLRLRILDVRVLDADGNGNFGNLVEGLMAFVDYCTDVLTQRPDAQFLINMSLGGTASSMDISATRAELDLALTLCNATSIAAAGNDNSGANTFYPAMIEGVVGVGASTISDRKAPFSNHNAIVDVFAPGVDILSTVPLNVAESGLGFLSGTSMAAPVVAGAVALLTSHCPRATRMACRQARIDQAALPNGMVVVPPATTRRLLYMGTERVVARPTPSPAPSPRPASSALPRTPPLSSSSSSTLALFLLLLLVACMHRL